VISPMEDRFHRWRIDSTDEADSQRPGSKIQFMLVTKPIGVIVFQIGVIINK